MLDNGFDEKKANQIGFAFSLVLNDSSIDLLHNSDFILRKLMDKKYQIRFVAVAFHDCDRNEFGDLKTPHYHVVIEFDIRLRLITCFNWIVDLFHLNPNQVSIQKCNDVGGQTRYLVHMDDDKYKYTPDIVKTNDKEQLDFYFSHFVIRNEKEFLTLIDMFPSKRQLLLKLGKKQYKDWRFAINDLLRY